MNKRYYVIALFISLILLVSACNQSGAAAGSAPRTPFIGGTAGLIPNLVLPKGTGHPSGNPLIILYGALAGAVIGVIYGSYNESKTTIVLGN